MPLKSKWSSKGIEEYLEKVANAGANIDEAASKAVDAGGEVILEGMERRAPELTGNLKRQIRKIGPDKDGNFHFVKVGVFNVKRNKAGASYLFYQEMGSVHNAPHPYIRPAFDEDKGKARKAELESLKESGAL